MCIVFFRSKVYNAEKILLKVYANRQALRILIKEKNYKKKKRRKKLNLHAVRTQLTPMSTTIPEEKKKTKNHK